MALIPRFTMNDIDRMLREELQDIEHSLIRIYRRVGVHAVNMARQLGNYQDRTSNLRGSIGYLIAVNGKIVDSLFEAPLGGYKALPEDGDKYGHSIAENFAAKVLENYHEGIVLIVVAGMNYAAAVESKNYDVLTGAEREAMKEMQKLLNQLRDDNDN